VLAQHGVLCGLFLLAHNVFWLWEVILVPTGSGRLRSHSSCPGDVKSPNLLNGSLHRFSVHQFLIPSLMIVGTAFKARQFLYLTVLNTDL